MFFFVNKKLELEYMQNHLIHGLVSLLVTQNLHHCVNVFVTHVKCEDSSVVFLDLLLVFQPGGRTLSQRHDCPGGIL